MPGPGSDAERLKAGETSLFVNTATLLSPRKDRAAVQFCISHSKESGCVVYLVRPDGHIQELEDDSVKLLLWTAGGDYLIGAGINTVRVWNLSGSVKTSTPAPRLAIPSVTQASFRITRLWLDRSKLCVAMESQVYVTQPQNPGMPETTGGQYKGISVTTTRYALPSLKSLTSATYPAGYGTLEADCQRVRPSF